MFSSLHLNNGAILSVRSMAIASKTRFFATSSSSSLNNLSVGHLNTCTDENEIKTHSDAKNNKVVGGKYPLFFHEFRHPPDCPCCSHLRKNSSRMSHSSALGGSPMKGNSSTHNAARELSSQDMNLFAQSYSSSSSASSSSNETDTEIKEALRNTTPDLSDILANNKKWVKEMTSQDPNFFKKLGAPQKPIALYLGCSDARVDPNSLMGLNQGSLFVHRNVGNVVSQGDMNLHTVLEFSVEHLQVPHIIVCGHYDCGAVRGSLGNTSGLPRLVEYWIRSIRDVQRTYRKELAAIDSIEDRHRRLVELNVIENCFNILKTGTVQRKLAENRDNKIVTPRIHGMVFDPSEGILKKLDLNWKNDVTRIYDLYDSDGQMFPFKE